MLTKKGANFVPKINRMEIGKRSKGVMEMIAQYQKHNEECMRIMQNIGENLTWLAKNIRNRKHRNLTEKERRRRRKEIYQKQLEEENEEELSIRGPQKLLEKQNEEELPMGIMQKSKHKKALQIEEDKLHASRLQEDEEKLRLQHEKNATFECQVCYEKKKIEESCITLNCQSDHRFCKDCLRNEILNKMKDKKVSEIDIKCFLCNTPINPAIIQNVLSFKEFEDFQETTLAFNRTAFTRGDEQVVKCPKCTYFAFASKENYANHCTCKDCGLFFCVRGCSNPHPGKTCEEQKRDVNNIKNDELFNQVKNNQRWKDCPGCRKTVQKIQGCNHITCTCGFQFCYVCGTKWKSFLCNH